MSSAATHPHDGACAHTHTHTDACGYAPSPVVAPATDDEKALMSKVIQKAVENVSRGGGPFAAAVVKDGKIISLTGNNVTNGNDPTAHAEVCAIRAACASLGSYQLDGCAVYTSCFPCPMCFGACYWARVTRVVYAASAADAADVGGFDDRYIYEEIAKPEAERQIAFAQLPFEHVERNAPFLAWKALEGRKEY